MVSRPYNGVEVIGAGWGRTGTMTLMTALEILGYDPCYHMVKVMKDRTPTFWTKAYFNEPYDFEEIFAPKQYRATCDFPSCYFWKEQLRKYPDAKVILTVRDPESWYYSCMDTIFRLMSSHPEAPLGLEVCKFFGIGPSSGFIELEKLLAAEATHDQQIGKEACIKLYLDHNIRVKNECPKEKLLVYEVSEGWEPLCKFLDKPIPDVPFPHVNDTFEFQRYLQGYNMFGYYLFVGIIILLAIAVYLITHSIAARPPLHTIEDSFY
jgi:hypothetical protein